MTQEIDLVDREELIFEETKWALPLLEKINKAFQRKSVKKPHVLLNKPEMKIYEVSDLLTSELKIY